MKVLAAYEASSGQLINKTKSGVFLHQSASEQVVRKAERVTRIVRQYFPFTYLDALFFMLDERWISINDSSKYFLISYKLGRKS